MNVLDLFSGIGGFSLGLERAGMRTIAFCEIEPFCQKILRKHWPDVPIFEDVRNLHAKDITKTVDIVAAGFPCQPASIAGKRRGTEDDRWLWPEVVRILRESSPEWGIFENVPGLITLDRGVVFDTVLSDLEREGYSAWPIVIPACAVNAPHRRDRVWILAYADDTGEQKRNIASESNHKGQYCRRNIEGDTTNSSCQLFDRAGIIRQARRFESTNRCGNVANPKGTQAGGVFGPWFSLDTESGCDWRGKAEEWTTESPVCSPNDGIPNRVARLKALGNAVVPQIPEIIGLAIMNSGR